MSAATDLKRKIEGKIIDLSAENRLRWRWYHGVAFWIIIQILTFGLSALVSAFRDSRSKNIRDLVGDVSYFTSLKQSIFTPPSWAFGPAWTINNFLTIWGTLHVLNKPLETPGRDAYLALQVASWVNFVAFNAAYFSLRSPLNALAITFTMFWLTIASAIVALLGLKDTKVALSLGTLFAWLIIALTAATFQVLWNHDDFYNVGPFVKPNRTLMKKKVR